MFNWLLKLAAECAPVHLHRDVIRQSTLLLTDKFLGFHGAVMLVHIISHTPDLT